MKACPVVITGSAFGLIGLEGGDPVNGCVAFDP
jgi:hypothetical protein